MKKEPTLVMIPCFSGSPWKLSQLAPLQHLPMRTMRLPDDLDDLERLADFVQQQVQGIDDYVLVGDSFGAVIAIVLAARQPAGLRGLVLSGGFAKNPLDSLLLKTLSALTPYFPGPFYRALTLRVHAAQLASSFDAGGEIPWSARKTREFFARETPHRAYVNRMRSIARADYVERLPCIDVPTLLLTPQEDRIIGKHAAGELLRGIRRSSEVVLAETGHMFRFSHPTLYARQVLRFLGNAAISAQASSGLAP